MGEVDINQNFTNIKNGHKRIFFSSVLSEHEALRRATLLKHRKVSTQLKLDMVQRQLSHLKRSVPDTEPDRQFYRTQVAELSSELQDLGSSLDRVERSSALYVRRKMLRQCEVSSSTGAIHLTSSHPAIFASSENLSSRCSLKERVCHLMSSPTSRFRKRHFFGELRAAASLSSLNVKSSSPSGSSDGGDTSPTKDSRSWRSPFRLLGSLVDKKKKKFWTSTKRTQSADHVLGCSPSGDEGLSSSDNEDYDEWRLSDPVSKEGITSDSQKVQIDPELMAEIEDFEKMAAQYIQQHS